MLYNAAVHEKREPRLSATAKGSLPFPLSQSDARGYPDILSKLSDFQCLPQDHPSLTMYYRGRDNPNNTLIVNTFNVFGRGSHFNTSQVY